MFLKIEALKFRGSNVVKTVNSNQYISGSRMKSNIITCLLEIKKKKRNKQD